MSKQRTHIRWSLWEIIRSKSMIAIALSVVIIIALLFATSQDITLFHNIDADELGSMEQLMLTVLLVVAVSLQYIVPIYVVLILIMWLIYSIRDWRRPADVYNRARHTRDTAFTWHLLYAMLFGCADFFAILMILMLVLQPILPFIGRFIDGSTALTGILFISLLLAEIRMRMVTKFFASRKGNADYLTREILAGQHDRWLLKSRRNPLGRAEVAKVLSLGIVRSLPAAVVITDVAIAMGSLRNISGILANALEAFLSMVTFGNFAQAQGLVEDVALTIAQGAPVFPPQTEPLKRKRALPRLIPEFVAIVIIAVVMIVWNA